MSRKRQSGYSLSEVLVVIAIVGLFTSIAFPTVTSMIRRSALRAAAGELRSIFHAARMRAIARSTNCGLKFFLADGEWQYAIYDDGDGDGVRNDDIRDGIDKRVAPARPALRESKAATIGLLDRAIKDPDGDALVPSAPPVRFNRSAICSFSPMGESTPGTIYLTDRAGELYAVRVYGISAKITTLRYDAKALRWVSR